MSCEKTPAHRSVCGKNAKPVGALTSSMRIPLISLLKFVSSGYFSFSLAIVFNFIFSQKRHSEVNFDGNGNLFDGFSRSCREEVSHGVLKIEGKVKKIFAEENNFFASHVSSLLRRKKSGVVLKSRSRCLKNFRNRQPGKTLEEIRTLGELEIIFSASRKCRKIASDQSELKQFY